MDRKIFRIEMDSLRQCVEHLRTLDLDGMEILAARLGSQDDRDLIAAVRRALADIPNPPLTLTG